MGTDFYDAAIRHYIDGTILQGEECYDNALYLYGNSVECTVAFEFNFLDGVWGLIFKF